MANTPLIDVRRTSAADYGRYVKALICGDPGAGKTLFSSTFPDPLYLVTEPGLMSVADRDVPFVKITSSDQLLNILQVLQQAPAPRAKLLGVPVQTVIIDTIDEMQGIAIAERLRDTKKDALALQDYGWLKEQTSAVLKGFRNLDMHVVFTCHLKDDKDELSGAVSRKPALAGAIAGDVAGYVDLAVLIKAQLETRVVGQDSVRVIARYLQTFPDHTYPWVKDRSGKLPIEFEVNFDDDFTRMARRIYGPAPTVPDTSTPVDAAEEAPAAVEVTVEGTDHTTVEVGEDEQTFVNTSEEAVEARESAPEAAQSAPGYTCTECSTVFTDENQKDLSELRFRKVLCRDCHTKAKAA